MKTIISKIELGDNMLKYTDVGYTTDVDLINQINEGYDSSLGIFLGGNRTKLELGTLSIGDFFTNTSFINEARIQVDSVEDTGLTEITKISQL